MTASVAARAAHGADLPTVVALSRQASAAVVDQRGGAVWTRREAPAEPRDEVLAAWFDDLDATRLAVVGTVDEVTVGFALIALDTLHDGRKLAVVSELYVEPEARAIGVGEAMLDLLVSWARERGAIGIDALALPGDRATKNFFETFGLTARAILVHRSFADEGPDPDDGGR